MGKVDQTLFLLRQGRDILIVQVYVDDIVSCRGYEQGISDEHDGQVAVLPRATNQAIKGRNICEPS
jgi:hypothetical protein